MVTDGRMLVQDQDGPADRGRPNKGGPRSRGSSGVGENHTRGCPRLVRASRLQGSQPTDGLGRDRMNAALLKTESFTAVDQPNSLCYSKSAVTPLDKGSAVIPVQAAAGNSGRRWQQSAYCGTSPAPKGLRLQ